MTPKSIKLPSCFYDYISENFDTGVSEYFRNLVVSSQIFNMGERIVEISPPNESANFYCATSSLERNFVCSDIVKGIWYECKLDCVSCIKFSNRKRREK